jgi:hypothetical protein
VRIASITSAGLGLPFFAALTFAARSSLDHVGPAAPG